MELNTFTGENHGNTPENTEGLGEPSCKGGDSALSARVDDGPAHHWPITDELRRQVAEAMANVKGYAWRKRHERARQILAEREARIKAEAEARTKEPRQ